MKPATPLLLAALALAAPAWAQVYKCPDGKGKVTYQESPCDANLGANRVNTQGTSGATFAPPKPKEGAEPAAAGAKPTGTAPAPEAGTKAVASPSPEAPKRKGNADERRFVSSGQKLADVVAKIGDPDKRVPGMTTRRSGVTYLETHTDIYDPVPGDPETRTIIQYSGYVVQSVRREVAR